MSTSVKKYRAFQKQIRNYLLISAFIACFSCIYEYFSHEVYSLFMICAFLYPLMLGAAPLILLQKMNRSADQMTLDLVSFAVAAFKVGSLIHGVFEIYGTTSHFTQIYWIAGILLLIFALISFLHSKALQSHHNS